MKKKKVEEVKIYKAGSHKLSILVETTIEC